MTNQELKQKKKNHKKQKQPSKKSLHYCSLERCLGKFPEQNCILEEKIQKTSENENIKPPGTDSRQYYSKSSV